MKKMLVALAFVLAFVRPALAAAVYDHAPPGDVVQTVNFNFATSKASGLYVAVLSRQLLGNGPDGRSEYQPYLTVYRQSPTTGSLTRVYQSPGSADALHVIPKREAIAHAAGIWMPHVEANIVGAGSLMEAGAQQLVVRAYEAGADCGMVAVHVLRLDGAQQIVEAARVENFCNLDAAISAQKLRLTGPYYAKDAPLCCPTKSDAQAVLSYSTGGASWQLQPAYFKLIPGSASAGVVEQSSSPETSCAVIDAEVGKPFAVTLPSNRTTGYAWQVDLATTAASVKMVSSTYVPSHSGLMGAPGTQVWNFVATARGTALLALRYLRSFEPNAPAKQAFYVVVTK